MDLDKYPTCRELNCVCFICQWNKQMKPRCGKCKGRIVEPDCKGRIVCPYENEIPFTDDGRDRRS